MRRGFALAFVAFVWVIASPRLAAAAAAAEAAESGFDFDFDFGTENATSQDDSFLLLSPRVDGKVVGNALTAYVRGRALFLPLTALATLLELGIQLSSKSGIASGFIITQDRPFFLNAGKLEIIYGNQRSSVNADDVLVKPEDIYVELNVLQRWLPIDFEVSTFGSYVNIIPREKTPLQLRLDRERRMNSLGAAYADPNYPRLANSYKLFDGPFVDQSLSGYWTRAGRTSTALGAYTTYLTADLMYLEINGYIAGTTDDALSDYRLTAGRHDYYGRLLGPLEAREFLVGDLFQPTQPLVSQSTRIKGATISNVPLNRPNETHGETLRGNLAPGWSVELYQDGFLVDFRKNDITGLYQFSDVPLHLGNNRIQLVFFGPYGERREENYSYNLAELLTQPGQLHYRVTAGEDESHFGTAYAEIDAGATDYLTFNGGFSSIVLDDERYNYASLGARALAGPVYTRVNMVQSSTGSRAYEAGARTQVAMVNLSTDLRHLDPGYLSASHLRRQSQLSNEVEVGAQSGFLLTPQLPLDVRLDGKRSDFVDRQQDYRLQNRLSTVVSDFAITNGANWIHNSSGRARADGQLSLSRNVAPLGDVRVNGEFMYELHPEQYPLGFGTHLTAELWSRTVGTAGFTRYFRGSTITDLGVSRDFSVVAVSLNGHYTYPRIVSAYLQTNLGLGYVDTQQTVYADSRPFGSSGAVLIKAFLDTNNNGAWDASEKAVQKAMVYVNGGSTKITTGRDGMAFIHSLTPYLPTNVSIFPGSLEDLSWVPSSPGVSIVPRPGRVSVIAFPIIPTGFVDGFVFYDRTGLPRELQGARIELWSLDGKRLQVTTTEFDGFFSFEKLPAGEYEIGVSEDDVSRLEGAPLARVPVLLKGDTMQASGQRFVIKVPPTRP